MAFKTCAASAGAGTVANEPMNEPIAVRAALVMTGVLGCMTEYTEFGLCNYLIGLTVGLRLQMLELKPVGSNFIKVSYPIARRMNENHQIALAGRPSHELSLGGVQFVRVCVI